MQLQEKPVVHTKSIVVFAEYTHSLQLIVFIEHHDYKAINMAPVKKASTAKASQPYRTHSLRNEKSSKSHP